MIDLFALALGHALLALAAWRLVLNDGLDANPAVRDRKKRPTVKPAGQSGGDD